MRTKLQHVECFHLVLLRMLEARVDRGSWVVKGGVNLRGWFGSLRYSEDLDIDVVRGGSLSLRDQVDRLLDSSAFRDMLATQGLTLVRTSKPKQTETTQRWKVAVQAEGLTLPLHTRVEFSRRGEEAYALEPVRPEIVGAYGLSTPTVNHYTARSAVRQKIEALAGRTETQARDVWDLEHLLRTTGIGPEPLTVSERKILTKALDRALGLSFDVFKAQVMPYLTPDDQEIYGTPEAWDRICELVVDRLSGLPG
jgi:predicted nucleotidyltransferase component of viral defense system